jgi:carbonic anhydrase/acetyltransferase-like protein (isoleucine patch superfamily)
VTVYQLENRVPTIAGDCFIAPSADVIGSVIMASCSSIWFNAVARGDNDQITIGSNSNIQDNTVLHTDPGCPLMIGKNVTVGHSVMLHGCLIGDNSLIGIGSVVLNKAIIGKSCLIGANTLITEGKTFPDRSLIMGSPGKVVREISEQEALELAQIAQTYIEKIARYQSLKVF